jgi:hypothetical protein
MTEAKTGHDRTFGRSSKPVVDLIQLPEISHLTGAINFYCLGDSFAAIAATGRGWIYIGGRPIGDIDSPFVSPRN